MQPYAVHDFCSRLLTRGVRATKFNGFPPSQAMLPLETQLEMDAFRREERKSKAEAKAEKARLKEGKPPQRTPKTETTRRE